MSMLEDLDLRYIRMGWFDQGRQCDEFVQYVTKLLPGETMPPRWEAENPSDFVQKFGTGPRWSKTASYHMLLINGCPVLRIWTNAQHVTNIEVSDRLKSTLEKEGFKFNIIPEGTLKRRKEFRWRRRLELKEELDLILVWVKVLYGLDD